MYLSCFILVSRVKKSDSSKVPYVKETEDDESKRRTTAFENPGYDSTGVGEDYDDMNPVAFAPFEETAEASGVTNPVYAEIGMTKMSSSQTINKDEAADETADPRYAAAGELPKKEPLVDNKEVKPDYVEIVFQKETPDQEKPQYKSLFVGKDEEAKNGQTAIEIENEEARYETLTDVKGTQSGGQQTGQTVLVLEDNDQPTNESES